jgi:hypothetical protein
VSGIFDHLTGLASTWAYVVVGLLAALTSPTPPRAGDQFSTHRPSNLVPP